MHANWWLDSGIPALKAVTDPEFMTYLLKMCITVDKSNPNRTGVEQELDLCLGFKSCKKWNKIGIFKGALGEVIGATVTAVFKRYTKEFGFSIAPKTKTLIIDFVSSFPAVLSKSYTPDVLRNCWSAGGKFDEKTRAPCPHAMISTIPGGVTDKEYKAISVAIASICAGPGLDVTESDLDRLGVREDRDFNENIVRRDPKITEEWRQRSKCLTTESQRKKRDDLIKNAMQAARMLHIKKRQAVLDHLAKNVEAETHLREILVASDVLPAEGGEVCYTLGVVRYIHLPHTTHTTHTGYCEPI